MWDEEFRLAVAVAQFCQRHSRLVKEWEYLWPVALDDFQAHLLPDASGYLATTIVIGVFGEGAGGLAETNNMGNQLGDGGLYRT